MVAFNDLSEVGCFLAAFAIVFIELFIGTSALFADWVRMTRWYKEMMKGENVPWILPPGTLAGITFVSNVFLLTSFYIFLQNVFNNTSGLWWELPIVVFFWLMCVATQKLWLQAFTSAGKHRVWAGSLLVMNMVAIIPIMVMYGLYYRWLELGFMFAPVVWWAVAAGIHIYGAYMDITTTGGVSAPAELPLIVGVGKKSTAAKPSPMQAVSTGR